MDRDLQLIITASNVFGLLPLSQLYHHERYYGMALTTCAILSSLLMHASETKRGMSGLFWCKYAYLFLNIDRFFAVMTVFYGLWLFYHNPEKTLTQLGMATYGIGMGIIGQISRNLPVHAYCHCMWHLLAYFTLGLVSF